MTETTDLSEQKYLVTREEIDAMDGLKKSHFMNENAVRVNKSLGDLVGLTGVGVHIIEVEPGFETTEYHKHYFEDECVYVLSGTASARIGDETHPIKAGDFIGYRKGGLAHTIINTGEDTFRCMVIGERLAQDVGDYPEKGKRIYRNAGMKWNLVSLDDISEPVAGAKK